MASSTTWDPSVDCVPWSEVGVDRKLPLLKFVEAQARSMDPAVDKVAVYWGDADERVMIATLHEGNYGLYNILLGGRENDLRGVSNTGDTSRTE